MNRITPPTRGRSRLTLRAPAQGLQLQALLNTGTGAGRQLAAPDRGWRRQWADRKGVPLDAELNLTDTGRLGLHRGQQGRGTSGRSWSREDGTVPRGSWLLVENLDRLSREPALDASYTMQGIIRAGVTVVDLSITGARTRVQRGDARSQEA